MPIHRDDGSEEPDRALIARLRDEMRSTGDPARAAAQQAYMKSALPYYGHAAPGLRALLRPHLAAYAPAPARRHEATLLALWDEATHREERYAALALARHRVARPWRDVESLVTCGGTWS